MDTILAPNSKVWIYQSAHPFNPTQSQQIQAEVSAFANQWVSHNRSLKARGVVLHNRFVVLMVDETQAGASGCSIDSSVHFMQQLEQRHQIQLFDRMRFSYKDNAGEIHTVSNLDFSQLYTEGTIGDDTIVFDTLVKTKADFDNAFEKPLKESWHQRMVG